jgi:V/A-type H+-transporting ATPase subunit D
MAKVALNKSSLAKEREKLKLYKRVLPSLELKRQQLMGARARCRQDVEAAEKELGRFEGTMGQEIPMLADRDLEISNLVRIAAVEMGEENVVGVRLPALKRIDTEVAQYSLLAKPPWVDFLVERLHEAAELRIKVQVARQRVVIMEQAVRRITQRVNLFEKIMIPTAKANIKRIQIYLGDAERSAVVRSKLAKSKRLKERDSLRENPQ